MSTQDDDDDSYGNYYGAGLNCPENDDRGNRSNVDFATIDDVLASNDLNHNNNEDDNADYDRSRWSFEELCRVHLRKFAKRTKRAGVW